MSQIRGASSAQSQQATPASDDERVTATWVRRMNERGLRLVMFADAAMLLAISVLSMIARFGLDWPSYPVTAYLTSFLVVTTVFVVALYYGGLYEREPRLGAPPVVPRAARQMLAAGGLVALLNLAATGLARELGVTTERALPLPVLNLIILMVLGAVGVAGNRWIVHALRTRREGLPKVIMAGQAGELELAREHISTSGKTQTVAEITDPARLVDAVSEKSATDVVLLSSRWLDTLYPQAIEALERQGVTVLLRVSARETMFGLERVREVGGLPFVLLRAQTVPKSRARFKRLFDLSLLLPTVVVWGPLVLLVAAYQAAVAGRPILFWQERVGVAGKRFRMVKFRTMVRDAEADGRGARLAERGDPRVIPACRWIRATRLDELPQLWNVLRGEMSLVGPRPERPELVEFFERSIPGYGRRHELPPGITGLAQIHGGYHTDAEYKLGYDLQYLVNWSLVLDIQILLRTLVVVTTRRP
jgi:exopolysaccharide biosynthesis polyprenyl glycosylphosphotransferase